MKYPVAIEWGDDFTATGIFIPDIPNAMTAGDTVEEAFELAVEVAHIQIEELLERKESIPLPSKIIDLKNNPEYAGYGWGVVDIDLSPHQTI